MPENAQRRNDVSPPGWEGTTEAMKSHGEISNPFALAWWMQEQGFSPHDAMNADVLDGACAMYTKAGHNDGQPYVTAGAKAGNGGAPDDTYMAQVESLEEIPEHEPDGFIPGIVHEANDGEKQMNFGKEDSDEMLLDDSEAEHFGADYPTGPTPNVAAGAHIGTHGAISDPEPENHNPEVEEAAHADEESEEEKDDSEEHDDSDEEESDEY